MISKSLIIFGNSHFASLAWYCLVHDSPYHAVAFTVDKAYLTDHPTHEGLPVVAFDEIYETHPPSSHVILLPLGYHSINGLRRTRFEKAIEMGYETISYISSRASIWPDLKIGKNCIIYEGAVIQPFSTIGNNIIIRSNAHISHHCKIADHVFIAAGAVLGGNVTVGEQAFVGLGAVIRDGVTIAPRSFIGAGAVVIADTEPDTIYVGNPARMIRQSATEVNGDS